MKRSLCLILSLVYLNLAGSIEFYQKSKIETALEKTQILDALKSNKSADLNNVVIVELLLKKFPGVNYINIVSRSMADKKSELVAKLNPTLPKPAGSIIAAPLPKPTTSAPPSGLKPAKVGLALSNPNDINNVVAVEYKLRSNFNKSYQELLNKSFKIKQQELQSLLGPKPATPVIGGAGGPPAIKATNFLQEIKMGAKLKPTGSQAQATAIVAQTAVEPQKKPVVTTGRSLLDELSQKQAARAGNVKPKTVISVPTGGAGEPKKEAGDPKVQKYVDMVKRRASDQEILAALIAPQPVNTRTLEALIPEDSTQDINDMNVLDYLLKTKYSQPQATLDKMYPYFKIIDIKRHLMPDEFKGIFMDIPWVLSKSETNFPNPARPRNQKFSRSWIEFPSPSIPRHLDYNRDFSRNKIYLLNSNEWIDDKNDYKFINFYDDVKNYYWSPNGETFTLIYKDDTYQSYDGMTGDPINERVPLPKEEEIVIEAETDVPAEEILTDPADAVNNNQKRADALKNKQSNESEAHFRARARAKLNTLGKFGISDNPAAVLAMAIWGLDRSFDGLTDENIATLRDYENNDENLNEITNLLKLEPKSTSLLDQAKVYIAIHSGWVNTLDSQVIKWAEALDAIEASSAGLTGIGSTTKVKFIDGIKLNNDIFVQTVAQYPTLSDEQNAILKKPGKYLRSLDQLLAKDPETADDFTKAKINLVLRSQWINEEDPENDLNMININKWKSAVGLM